MMTREQLRSLGTGDIIRNEGSGTAYVVVHNNGRSITAVRAIDVSNEQEWTLIDKGTNRPVVANPQALNGAESFLEIEPWLLALDADGLNEVLALQLHKTWAEVTETDPTRSEPPTQAEMDIVRRCLQEHRNSLKQKEPWSAEEEIARREQKGIDPARFAMKPGDLTPREPHYVLALFNEANVHVQLSSALREASVLYVVNANKRVVEITKDRLWSEGHLEHEHMVARLRAHLDRLAGGRTDAH